ncbi:phosphate ABC transporter permease subunit PstC [Pseudoalteromonas rubra]|uniref:Phosphate ABC transporter permease subunit PstC n=1 Tax=Pseudoalteromonas rubra TaxID=43658 RepID=A0A4Q7E842_9GAMM|nr:ABC transporter permease subunit [Pseudoalteromonas rubra]RZM78456.1 phosphate ABC transporter permease subunit PstC [Pseudoalteromonas rubra]
MMFVVRAKVYTVTWYAWMFIAVICIAVSVGLIFSLLANNSMLAIGNIGIKQLMSFEQGWFPLDGELSLVPMLMGSIWVSVGAMALAVPLCLLVAIYIVFYLPNKIQPVVHLFIVVVAALPSVFYGFWGMIYIVPYINQIKSPGASLFAGQIVLAMMVSPMLIALFKSQLETVRKKHQQQVSALGIAEYSAIWPLYVTNQLPAIFSLSILGFGRVIGETMVVTMVTGNVVAVPDSIFEPVRTLTANIALEMAYAVDEHRSALFFSGFILLVLIVFLSVARLTLARVGDAQ